MALSPLGRVSDLISALSYALDLTEGQAPGHSVQSCLIGMRLAREIGMPVDLQADLYYALLLKDAGCSSNASRLFHIIHSDEIKAKGNLKDKGLDESRVGKPAICAGPRGYGRAFSAAGSDADSGCGQSAGGIVRAGQDSV